MSDFNVTLARNTANTGRGSDMTCALHAACDEIERLRARITELEAERGARLKMGQRLAEAADQWLAAEENKRPESTLRENAYQFTSVAMELADVYRQALARSTDTEDE